MLPSRENIWVNYRKSTTEQWIAYAGQYVIEEMGGVGERYRAHFDELKLIDPCGQERILSAGEIDTAIGAEAIFPESEVDLEQEAAGSTQQLENAALLSIDGQQRICEGAYLDLTTLSAAEAGTGQAEDVLEFRIICGCGYDETTENFEEMFTFMGYLPPAGQGPLEINQRPYIAYIMEDVKHTPLDPMDDDVYMPTNSAILDYQTFDPQAGGKVEVVMTNTVTFAFVDLGVDPPVLDNTRIRIMDQAHFWGLIERDCRPASCP